MPVPLPDLVLQAVTESASVMALHRDGAVLWHKDALEKLRRVLTEGFEETARDEEVIEKFLNIMAARLEKGDAMEEIARKLILFTLLDGTGIGSDT